MSARANPILSENRKGLRQARQTIHFRADRERGVIRCFIREDGREVCTVGTLDVTLADSVPGLWDEWRVAIQACAVRCLEHALGEKVVRTEAYPVRPPQPEAGA